MGDQVVFSSAFETLKRIVGEDAAISAYFTSVGIDFTKLSPAYPRDTWNSCVEFVARARAPGAPRHEALRALGRSTVEHFSTGMMGAALFALLKLIGPRRALARTTRNFRTTNNYTESRIEEKSANESLIWMNEQDFAHYTVGILEAGVTAAGGKSVVVEIVGTEGEGTLFRCTWG